MNTEKKIYLIWNDYVDPTRILLTKDQVALIAWLIKEFRSDINFKLLDKEVVELGSDEWIEEG